MYGSGQGRTDFLNGVSCLISNELNNGGLPIRLYVSPFDCQSVCLRILLSVFEALFFRNKLKQSKHNALQDLMLGTFHCISSGEYRVNIAIMHLTYLSKLHKRTNIFSQFHMTLSLFHIGNLNSVIRSFCLDRFYPRKRNGCLRRVRSLPSHIESLAVITCSYTDLNFTMLDQLEHVSVCNASHNW